MLILYSPLGHSLEINLNIEVNMEYCCEREYEMNYIGNYGRGSRLPPRAPHIIGIKTKQTIIQTIKKQTIMKKINVNLVGGAGGNSVNHVVLSAGAIAVKNGGNPRTVKLVTDIAIEFPGEDITVSCTERTIPGEKEGDRGTTVTMVSIAMCKVTGYDTPNGVNITRIVGLMTSKETYKDCVEELINTITDEDGKGVITDIEYLETFGTWRFTNARVLK